MSDENGLSEGAAEGPEPADPAAGVEPQVPRGNPDMPDLRNWGGLRNARSQVRRSATIMANREAIAYELLAMASTKITDVMEWDEAGNVKLVASKKLDPRHARMIKSVKQTFNKDGEVASLEVTLYDKPGLLRTLAQAAGLLAKDAEDDKPSVVGVTVRGPRARKTVTYEVKGVKDE